MAHKIVHIQSSDGIVLKINIEEYYSTDNTIFIWPCALLLSSYLASCVDCEGKVFLEIGSG